MVGPDHRARADLEAVGRPARPECEDELLLDADQPLAGGAVGTDPTPDPTPAPEPSPGPAPTVEPAPEEDPAAGGPLDYLRDREAFGQRVAGAVDSLIVGLDEELGEGTRLDSGVLRSEQGNLELEIDVSEAASRSALVGELAEGLHDLTGPVLPWVADQAEAAEQAWNDLGVPAQVGIGAAGVTGGLALEHLAVQHGWASEVGDWLDTDRLDRFDHGFRHAFDGESDDGSWGVESVVGHLGEATSWQHLGGNVAHAGGLGSLDYGLQLEGAIQAINHGFERFEFSGAQAAGATDLRWQEEGAVGRGTGALDLRLGGRGEYAHDYLEVSGLAGEDLASLPEQLAGRDREETWSGDGHAAGQASWRGLGLEAEVSGGVRASGGADQELGIESMVQGRLAGEQRWSSEREGTTWEAGVGGSASASYADGWRGLPGLRPLDLADPAEGFAASADLSVFGAVEHERFEARVDLAGRIGADAAGFGEPSFSGQAELGYRLGDHWRVQAEGETDLADEHSAAIRVVGAGERVQAHLGYAYQHGPLEPDRAGDPEIGAQHRAEVGLRYQLTEDAVIDGTVGTDFDGNHQALFGVRSRF